jgi:hypothetical protein
VKSTIFLNRQLHCENKLILIDTMSGDNFEQKGLYHRQRADTELKRSSFARMLKGGKIDPIEELQRAATQFKLGKSCKGPWR